MYKTVKVYNKSSNSISKSLKMLCPHETRETNFAFTVLNLYK